MQKATKSTTTGGMGPSGDPCKRTISRHLKVLLPPSTSSSQKLRISDELARHLDGDAGGGGLALVVSPFGSKVWRVEVSRDGNGAFLGRGWPEFVAVHGIGVSWFLVLRHEGGGVLTVKAFDTSFCLHEFSRPTNAAELNQSNTAGTSQRPQFIKVLQGSFTETMVIPPEFVRKYVTGAGTNSPLAVLLHFCGKHWRVEAEKDQSGNVFFSGGWSRFLASNGISEGDSLVLRYEGNLVFTVKAFGVDGCQKSFKSAKVSCLPQIDETDQTKTKRPASSSTPSKKGTAAATSTSVGTYDIGPPSWIRKRITDYVLKNKLSLAQNFCKAIGFSQNCEITLNTLTENGTTRSWQVHGLANSSSNHRQLGKGWISFCRDNRLKEGDICTFNITQTMIWDVDISRCFDVA